MMPNQNSIEESEEQVRDLQSQMDQSRSECIRPIIFDHIHRYSRAKNHVDKAFELESLITLCTPYIEDEEVRLDMEKEMETPEANFSSDFIRNYKAEWQSGVSYQIAIENEARKVLPVLRKIWSKVQKEMIKQELIPWTLSYPEKMLEGALMNQLITELQGGITDLPKLDEVIPAEEPGNRMERELRAEEMQDRVRRMKDRVKQLSDADMPDEAEDPFDPDDTEDGDAEEET